MRRSMNRAERLQEMERLYFQRGYSDIEMAERLGVDRTTVFRDRSELETQTPFIQQEDGRYRIDRTQYLSSIRVNLNEALALYLAARRASQQTRSGQPHTASALEKLALALRQPMTSRLVQAADRILAQQNQPERLKILETITQAWVESRTVRMSYRSLHGQRAMNYQVQPYLIEPSPWSDGVYLIGHCDVFGEIAVFKIDRIESASLSSETFSLPEDFDEAALLKFAWGIWLSDREPYTVTLRFAPGAAARRLQESIWHPTQEIIPLTEGGCLWKAKVAEWQEMLPWVRGWGAEVEVIEPQEMRMAIIRDAKRLTRVYKLDAIIGLDDENYDDKRFTSLFED